MLSKFKKNVEILLDYARNCYKLLLRGIRIIKNEGFKILLTKTRQSLKLYQNSRKTQSNIKNMNVDKTSDSNTVLPNTNESYISYLLNHNDNRSKEYESVPCKAVGKSDTKLIAFYLPQFHPIPENDIWWGKGFTEWANVSRAVPQFIGHHQPKLPGELGFYDLRIPDIQKRQVELANLSGMYGFCFHFYWFNGKRLLEAPLEQFLSKQDLNIKFCINWANENWSRKWDGRDDQTLIKQEHSDNDDLAFIRYISKYFRDFRYIRIDGKPLLIIYRPAEFPDAKKTAERWRSWCRNNGIGEIYLALTHSFESLNPKRIGFDAAIEFPPNSFMLDDISGQFEIKNRNYRGHIYDYNQLIQLARNFVKPDYKKFRGICPAWDNEARKPGKATLLANSSPEAYKEWLELILNYTDTNFAKEEKLVFINAWNEWAEGAYLEPDRWYGYAYLNKTAEALSLP